MHDNPPVFTSDEEGGRKDAAFFWQTEKTFLCPEDFFSVPSVFCVRQVLCRTIPTEAINFRFSVSKFRGGSNSAQGTHLKHLYFVTYLLYYEKNNCRGR